MNVEKEGLLPGEVKALRHVSGLDMEAFGDVLGVSPNVIERWEELGVPSGPTAVALRFIARDAGFEFPDHAPSELRCTICGSAAQDTVHGLPVCRACHREPVESLEGLGYEVTRTENYATRTETLSLKFPEDAQAKLGGRFMSEGLGTMLTKLFKEEPQLGHPTFDDAVYVQWLSDAEDVLQDAAVRQLLANLVAFGVVEIESDHLEIDHVPNWFEGDVILVAGLLAARLTAG